MAKKTVLPAKTFDEAVPRMDQGASFPEQGFEVITAVDDWGWAVKLLDTNESTLFFAADVKTAAKKYPNLVTKKGDGYQLNDQALAKRTKAKAPVQFKV